MAECSFELSTSKCQIKLGKIAWIVKINWARTGKKESDWKNFCVLKKYSSCKKKIDNY